jgi:tetratricopeptide (TPR) repeat protein
VSNTFQRKLLHPMPEASAFALFRMGLNYKIAGEHRRAQRFFEASLKGYRALEWPYWVARVADHAGHNARERGDVQTARSLQHEAIQITGNLDPAAVPFLLNALAGTEALADDADESQSLLLESEQQLTQWPGIDPMTKLANHAWNLNHLGHVAAMRGQHREALDLYRQSIETFAMHDHPNSQRWCWLWCHQNMAESSLALQDFEQARRHASECFTQYQDFSDKMALSWCLATLAGVCALDEEPERGATLWGASEALREQLGCRIAPASRLNRERTMMLLREQLGEAEFARLVAEGAKMSMDEAFEFAQAGA